MEITTKQLRSESGRIISQVSNGQEITLAYRGKPRAKIILIAAKRMPAEELENELFGIWKDREDLANIEQFVRNIRKDRKF